MALGHLSWDQEKLFGGKNRVQKISWDCPFKNVYVIIFAFLKLLIFRWICEKIQTISFKSSILDVLTINYELSVGNAKAMTLSRSWSASKCSGSSSSLTFPFSATTRLWSRRWRRTERCWPTPTWWSRGRSSRSVTSSQPLHFICTKTVHWKIRGFSQFTVLVHTISDN